MQPTDVILSRADHLQSMFARHCVHTVLPYNAVPNWVYTFLQLCIGCEQWINDVKTVKQKTVVPAISYEVGYPKNELLLNDIEDSVHRVLKSYEELEGDFTEAMLNVFIYDCEWLTNAIDIWSTRERAKTEFFANEAKKKMEEEKKRTRMTSNPY